MLFKLYCNSEIWKLMDQMKIFLGRGNEEENHVNNEFTQHHMDYHDSLSNDPTNSHYAIFAGYSGHPARL